MELIVSSYRQNYSIMGLYFISSTNHITLVYINKNIKPAHPSDIIDKQLQKLH